MLSKKKKTLEADEAQQGPRPIIETNAAVPETNMHEDSESNAKAGEIFNEAKGKRTYKKTPEFSQAVHNAMSF